MDKTPKRAPPAAMLLAGKVRLTQRADGSILLTHEKQPNVQVEVSARQLETWAMRHLREGAFA